MKIELFDIILIISIFQLLVFTVFLFSKKPSKISNIILGVFLLSQAIVILKSFLQQELLDENYTHFLLIGAPFRLIWGPTFYFYVKSLAHSNFKLKPLYILHYFPFFIGLILFSIFLYFVDAETMKIISRPGTGIVYTGLYILSFIVILQILIYNIISLHILYTYQKRLKENFSSLSKINFSWFSFVIIGYTIAHIISSTIQIISFSEGYNEFTKVSLYLIFLIFFNIIFFKAWQQPEIFSYIEENIKYKASRLTKQEAEEWKRKLSDFIKSDKPYLNPGLTINQLSESIGISPRTLSQIINEHYNQNFYDYINKLRIEESKIMLLDSSNKRTVLEILYDVGFNSKTAFNVAFKKVTGYTPTDFRKKAEKDSVHSEKS